MEVKLLIFLFQCTMAIFVILNPFGNVPIVLSLTSGLTPAERKSVVLRSSLTALIILLLFALAGQFIFDIFHITIGAFRIAGGILLFIICLSMTRGELPKSKITPQETEEASSKADVAITPLGTPMMAGPGSIATVIGLMDQARNWNYKGMVLLSIPIAVLVGYILLRFGSFLMSKMGPAGLRVVTRMMGLILAVIAVQFVILGIRDALPQILKHSIH